MAVDDAPHQKDVAEIRCWRLSDHIGRWLEVTCCKGIVMYPLRLMTLRHGDATIGQVVDRLRCKKCKGPPKSVILHENHQTVDYGGSKAGWAVRLVDNQRS